MSKFTLLDIQFFNIDGRDFDNNGNVIDIERYSANVGVEKDGKKFLIQPYGNKYECGVSIPEPSLAFYESEADQEWASDADNVNIDEVMADLEKQGFENNYNWLKENANSII